MECPSTITIPERKEELGKSRYVDSGLVSSMSCINAVQLRAPSFYKGSTGEFFISSSSYA